MDGAEGKEEKKSRSIDEQDTYNDFICIDILGFRAKSGVFVCKEFCLIDKEYIFHTLIETPPIFPKLNSMYRYHLEYNLKYGHQLSLECGDITISNLICQVLPKIQNKIILVEHFVTAKFLNYIFRHCSRINCITLDEIGCKTNSIKKKITYALCDYHNKVYGWDRDGPCALSTALKLKTVNAEMSLK